MARRVYLHIGTPKSGTSYLQDRVHRNRDRLAADGLEYPELRSGDHFEAALDLIDRSWGGELERARGQWNTLAEAVRRDAGDVLVSHEILAAARPDQVARATASLGDAEPHLVLTARDLARQIPAEWQEMVKHRTTASFGTFLRRLTKAPRTGSEMWFWRVQALPDVLTRWGNGLTPAQIHLVTVPHRDAPPEALWERYLSVFGLPTDRDYAPAEQTNPSLGIAEVAVLRRLNRRLRKAQVSRETYVPLVRELIARETFGAHEQMETAVLPAQLRPFVEEVTEEWVEWIVGSGIDVVGDLEDLRPHWNDEPSRDPDRPRQAQVAQYAIEALAAVLIEIDRTGPFEDLNRGARRIGRRLLGS